MRTKQIQSHSKKRSGRIISFAFSFLTILINSISAQAIDPVTLYVDPRISVVSCSNYNPATGTCGSGTATAYRTIAGAMAAATAGNTVLIRGGIYAEQLAPPNSGTAGSPITFKNYPGELVYLSSAPAINLANRNYVVIDGLHAEDTTWLEAKNSHYNVVQNCVFKRTPATGTTGNIRFVQSHYNRILNNYIEEGNDNLLLIDSNFNVVQGNAILQGRHSIFGIRCGDYNVIRSNYFANTLQKIGEVYDCGADTSAVPNSFNSTKHNVIEDNVFADASSYYSTSGGSGIQYGGQEGIIRRNVFYHCNVGLSMAVYADESLYNVNNSIYHNVFYENDGAGVSTSSGSTGNIFKNNVLFNNKGVLPDCFAVSPGQLSYRTAPGGASTLYENTDLFYQAPGQPVVEEEFGAGHTMSQINALFPGFFVNTFEVNPQFVDAAHFDFHLAPASPLTDAGAFLTKVVGNGTGTILPAQDAGFFYDGYGIPGETGDLIQLSGQSATARIIQIDYGNNRITLDRSLTWNNGQGLALAFNGAAPDVGAFESGSATLPTVTIRASDATAGEPGGDTGQWIIERTGSTSSALTVNYTVGGTAVAGSDYVSLGSSVTIAAGSSTATVTLTALDDAVAEGLETVIVSLAVGGSYVVGSSGSATVTISDDDSGAETSFVASTVLDAVVRNDWNGWVGMKLTVGAQPLTVTALGRIFVSGNNGTHTVKLVRASDQVDVPGGAVSITMTGGSAGQFKYAPLSSPVTLAAGTSYCLASKEVYGGDYWHDYYTTVTTTSAGTCDGVVYAGGNSPFTLFSAPNHCFVPVDFKYATGALSPPTVTIRASDATAGEPGGDTGQWIIERTGSTSSALTVNYTVGGTAVAGSDYVSLGSSVTIAAGSSTATVTLTALDDAVAEGLETVIVSLAVGGSYVVGSSGSATVTISDDDSGAETSFVASTVLDAVVRNDWNGWVGMKLTVGAQPLTVTALGRIFVSGNNGTHTVKLVRASDQVDVPGGAVSITMTGGSAGQFKYAPLSSPVTLAAGTSYCLASKEVYGGDYWHDYYTTVTTTSAGTCDGVVYAGGNSPFTLFSAPNHCFVPVDFKYATGALSPPTVTIRASDATAGEPGGDTGQWIIERTGSTSSALTVNYTVGGTAVAGSGGYVIGSAGSATVTISDDDSGAETSFVASTVLDAVVRNDWNGWVGMKLTVGAQPLTVTALGRIFVSGNNGTHTVKLVRASDQVDVPGGAVSITMTGGSAGQFKYAPLSSPVTLAAGSSYFLVSQEVGGGDYWHNVNEVTTKGGTCDGAAFAGSGYPWMYGGPNLSFVPVDFKFKAGE